MKDDDGSGNEHSKTGNAASGVRGAPLDDKFSEKLKEVYADVVNEPVPDRFLELLARLDEGDASGGDGSSSDDTSSGDGT